jgi:hypothetical protein
MNRFAIGMVVLGTLTAAFAQGGVQFAQVVTLWAGPSGDLAGATLINCVPDQGRCGNQSEATRFDVTGKRAVIKYQFGFSPVVQVVWRDLNRNGAMDAGDEIGLIQENMGSIGSYVQLERFDGDWRKIVSQDALETFYNLMPGDTSFKPPAGEPLSFLTRIPVTASRVVQPDARTPRGSLEGSWALLDSRPRALAEDRIAASIKGTYDTKWPPLGIALQAKTAGRFLMMGSSIPTTCQGTINYKTSGEFTTTATTLTFNIKENTKETRCQPAPSNAPATKPSAQAVAQCNQAVAMLPANVDKKLYLEACLKALSQPPQIAPTPTVERLPLGTYSYRYQRIDLRLTDNAREGNYFLFLEDEKGNVYRYLK